MSLIDGTHPRVILITNTKAIPECPAAAASLPEQSQCLAPASAATAAPHPPPSRCPASASTARPHLPLRRSSSSTSSRRCPASTSSTKTPPPPPPPPPSRCLHAPGPHIPPLPRPRSAYAVGRSGQKTHTTCSTNCYGRPP